MDCPRCKLTLRETDYEGVEVDMCDSCWGFWLDKGELQEVIDTREMSFSQEERNAFAGGQGVSSAPAPEETPKAECPHCGQAMDLVHSDVAIQLVIDRCPDHGIWLDAGEIKAVQVASERSAEFHKLLLGKLGVRKRG